MVEQCQTSLGGKARDNEKSFPALHKAARFCDVSLINVYTNAVFVYISYIFF